MKSITPFVVVYFRNKVALTVILLLPALFSNAQVGNIIPPAPTTREFNKYLNFDVSLEHGVPNISIPLYEIKLKGITIPINLSYNASGIKFGQMSGNVGLGWVINPGYRVSRTVYGFPDEKVPMPADVVTSLSQYENNAFTNQGIFNRDGYLSKFVVDGYQQFGVVGQLDGEYDQFQFSLPDKSGSFIISDRANKVVASSETPNMKFDYMEGTSVYSSAYGTNAITGIKGMKITDEHGLAYAFGEYYPSNGVALEHSLFASTGFCGVAWGLTDITDPTGDNVKFKYVEGEVGENSVDYNKIFQFFNANTPCTDEVSTSSLSTRDDIGWYKTIFPSEIQTRREKVVFNHTLGPNNNKLQNIIIYSDTGKPIKKINFFYTSGSYAYTSYYLLDHITICGGDSDVPVETYRFNYYSNPFEGYQTTTQDQWGFMMSGDPDNYFHDEFADDVMQFKAATSLIDPKPMNHFVQSFSRRERLEADDVPKFYSLKKITFPTGGYTEYDYEHNLYTEANSGNVRLAGIRVKQINSFDLIKNESITRRYKYGTNESGWGLATLLASHRLFVTEKLRMSIMPCQTILIKNLQRIGIYSTNMQGDAASDVFQSGFVWYPEVTEYMSGSATDNSKIKHFFNTGGSYTIQQLAKKNTAPTPLYETFFPINFSDYRTWDKPYLEGRKYYDQNNTLVKAENFSYESYNHQTFTGLKVRPFVSTEEALYLNTTRINDGTYYYTSGGDRDIQSFFDYGHYTINLSGRRLIAKSEVDYRSGATVTTESAYEYNSQNLLAKETIKKSTGNISSALNQVTYTTYPQDYAAGTTFVDDMKLNNLVGMPIEKVSYLDNGGVKTILSGSISQYKTGGKGLMDSQWSLDSPSPIAQSAFKFSNMPIGTTPFNTNKTSFSSDSRYKKRVVFDSYDIWGNIQQLHKEFGPATSYLWDYKLTNPIAEIKNSALTDAAYTSFEADGSGSWTIPSSTRSSLTAYTGKQFYNLSSGALTKSGLSASKTYVVSYWTKNSSPFSITGTAGSAVQNQTAGDWTLFTHRVTGQTTITITGSGAIDEVKLYPLGGTMTTYTYEPLVGITSSTDERNNTTYYEYDQFNRLTNIRDQKGNILKNTKYHYRP
jgi:YD repeat-containing protein